MDNWQTYEMTILCDKIETDLVYETKPKRWQRIIGVLFPRVLPRKIKFYDLVKARIDNAREHLQRDMETKLFG